jgi:TRAP-type uncharacterized transport system substrate-binding protein
LGRIYATAAFTALERGKPEGAVYAVQAAAAAPGRYGVCPTCSALLNPVATEAFATLGGPENAGLYSRAAGRVADFISSSAWKAMAETSAGSVAKVQGDQPAARYVSFASRQDLGPVRTWKAIPEMRERLATVLQHVDDFHSEELELVVTASDGDGPVSLVSRNH